tara:strand:- start:81 stop:323 length:243 start_codon:yes stop_codon:yes gene_type:complete
MLMLISFRCVFLFPFFSNFSLELGHADGVSPSAGGGGGGGFSTRSSVCSLEDSWKGKSSGLGEWEFFFIQGSGFREVIEG